MNKFNYHKTMMIRFHILVVMASVAAAALAACEARKREPVYSSTEHFPSCATLENDPPENGVRMQHIPSGETVRVIATNWEQSPEGSHRCIKDPDENGRGMLDEVWPLVFWVKVRFDDGAEIEAGLSDLTPISPQNTSKTETAQ